MKAAVVYEFSRPLTIDDVPIPEPGRGEVVTESRRLDQVNESFEQILKGEVDARLVFDFR